MAVDQLEHSQIKPRKITSGCNCAVLARSSFLGIEMSFLITNKK